jgi:hypothetical protein
MFDRLGVPIFGMVENMSLRSSALHGREPRRSWRRVPGRDPLDIASARAATRATVGAPSDAGAGILPPGEQVAARARCCSTRAGRMTRDQIARCRRAGRAAGPTPPSSPAAQPGRAPASRGGPRLSRPRSTPRYAPAMAGKAGRGAAAASPGGPGSRRHPPPAPPSFRRASTRVRRPQGGRLPSGSIRAAGVRCAQTSTAAWPASSVASDSACSSTCRT